MKVVNAEDNPDHEKHEADKAAKRAEIERGASAAKEPGTGGSGSFDPNTQNQSSRTGDAPAVGSNPDAADTLPAQSSGA